MNDMIENKFEVSTYTTHCHNQDQCNQDDNFRLLITKNGVTVRLNVAEVDAVVKALAMNLRKCKTGRDLAMKYPEVYYFHRWTEIGKTIFHGEDPQKDTTYAATYALLENIETGETIEWPAGDIVFLKDHTE